MLNRLIAGTLPLLPKRFVWLFSRSYIAGETVDDAMAACTDLNAAGIKTTIDILGEFIRNMDEAKKNCEEYLALIDVAQRHGIDGNYSVKPTMFGLLIDAESCYGHLREIVARAAGHGNFIRIDMEDSGCVDLELDVFRRLKTEFPENVGLVLQAYLRRTRDDLKALMDLHTPSVPLNFRLCKGIYAEPGRIAYQRRDEINAHFLQDLEFMFQNGVYPGIATHDRALVDGALALIDRYQVARDGYEFQMLYGVTPELRRTIIEAGHTMRVYVPYGRHWFGYSTRRLKENPKIVNSILKSILLKK
ncbi:proline dehydrogenase [Desulfosarcina alkanivorans]|uniref:proline dehydrogenase n=1 Tax=Desulfosarcina alkanivorans TaxID=571177 RepID=A0A5K7YUP3_9BACT|nr:proline dehydrogenase family protein [Desulfosarcina alkanivorans]BBO70741.1 proline dehydrogenase [Desulfosarcina alkanivorans]